MAALFLIADILCATDSPLELVLRHYWFVEKVKSVKDFLSEGMMLKRAEPDFCRSDSQDKIP